MERNLYTHTETRQERIRDRLERLRDSRVRFSRVFRCRGDGRVFSPFVYLLPLLHNDTIDFPQRSPLLASQVYARSERSTGVCSVQEANGFFVRQWQQ